MHVHIHIIVCSTTVTGLAMPLRERREWGRGVGREGDTEGEGGSVGKDGERGRKIEEEGEREGGQHSTWDTSLQAATCPPKKLVYILLSCASSCFLACSLFLSALRRGSLLTIDSAREKSK